MRFAQTRSTPLNQGPQAVTEEVIRFLLHLEATAVAEDRRAVPVHRFGEFGATGMQASSVAISTCVV